MELNLASVPIRVLRCYIACGQCLVGRGKVKTCESPIFYYTFAAHVPCWSLGLWTPCCRVTYGSFGLFLLKEVVFSSSTCVVRNGESGGEPGGSRVEDAVCVEVDIANENVVVDLAHGNAS